MKKLFVWIVWQLDTWLTILSTRVVQWTGRSQTPLHPKHLANLGWMNWYLPFVPDNALLLDIGCNHAAHTLAALGRARAAIGIDRSASLLRAGQLKTRSLPSQQLLLLQGDLESSFPLADTTIDSVLFLDVLEHLVHRDFALREVHRVLRPGGLLFLSIPQRETSWKRLRQGVGLPGLADPDHKYEYTRQEIMNILDQHGFDVEQVDVTVVDTPLAGWIDLVGAFSLPLYRRLSGWKRQSALHKPKESTGFRLVARRRHTP